jgi:hypothetical protein
MTRDEARGMFVQLLLERVRQDAYPSWTQLNLIEESIPQDMIPDYLELLVEKVARDKFPSIQMLRRIQRVAAALPAGEQRAG